MSATELIPVTVLTGFLGAGKTTLLNRLIGGPELRDALVLVNEFGEIGLDHELMRPVEAGLVLMESGCLCCTIHSDLARTLTDMAAKRRAGTVPSFARVVIETTGLADPAPVLMTLMRDPMLAGQFRLDGVATVVDAVNAATAFAEHEEARRQTAVADRIVLSKTDLADPERRAAAVAAIRALNPAAPLLDAAAGEATAAALLNAGLFNPATKTLDVQGWLRAEAYAAVSADAAGAQHHHDHAHDHEHAHDHHDVNRHDGRIRAVCLTRAAPVDWDRFAAWAQSLALYRGDDLLRLKAILDVAGRAGPVAVHAVRHLFHPPAELPEWPSAARGSRIVLIMRDADPDGLATSLAAALDGA